MNKELGTADNVKDRKNAKFIKKGLTYLLQHLKSLSSVPPNGLVLFSGHEWCWF